MQRGLPPSEEQLGATSRLEQQPGQKIGIGGNPTLVRSLHLPASAACVRRAVIWHSQAHGQSMVRSWFEANAPALMPLFVLSGAEAHI
jgi:hypothetical protein